MKKLLEKITETENEFIQIRHKFHQFPELGFQETKTSSFIEEKLTEYGYKIYKNMATTGIVGKLTNGSSKKSIGLRADIDALPIKEESGQLWQSENDNMHACGHDGHAAMLLCAAKYLAETKNFSGTVNLIFQPAEELLYGGRVMLEDGLFEKCPCDAIFGMHNMPPFEEGVFGFIKGPAMASADTIEIKIIGKSTHGAQPNLGIDATLIACYIATGLQTIVSRNISPFVQAVVTIGSIQAGSVPNIIAKTAIFKLSVRALDKKVREILLEKIEQIANLQAESFGAKAEIKYINSCPLLVNNNEMADFSMGVAEKLFGKDSVTTNIPSFMISEDFAYMLEAVPKGNYCFIGNGSTASVHNSKFDFNDKILIRGAAFWSALVEEYLK